MLNGMILTSTHNLYFSAKIRKILYTSVNPTFFYIKRSFPTCSFHGLVYLIYFRGVSSEVTGLFANYSDHTLKRSGPKVMKHFSCSTQLSMKFILPINIKMPTFVGILMFISKINFMLSWVEHEKLINSLVLCYLLAG